MPRSPKKMPPAAPPDRRRQARERRTARANPVPANDAVHPKNAHRRILLIAAGRQGKGEQREPIPPRPAMPRSPRKMRLPCSAGRRRQAGERRAARANPVPADEAEQSEKKIPPAAPPDAAGRQGKGELREPIPPRRTMPRIPKKIPPAAPPDRRRQAGERRAARANPVPANAAVVGQLK